MSEHQNSRYTELIGLSITYNQVSLDVVPDCTPCPTANIQVCKDGAESEELTSFTSIEKLRAHTHTHTQPKLGVQETLFLRDDDAKIQAVPGLEIEGSSGTWCSKEE